MNKQLIRLLFILFLGSGISLETSAQGTLEYSEPSTVFEHAKMLYVKKQYVPAIQAFEDFLATKPGPNFNYESRAYIALSRLHLEKSGASRELAQLRRDEPEHKLTDEIGYELGLYYFRKGKYRRALKYLEEIKETDIAKSKREELIFKKGYSLFKNEEYTLAKDQFAKIMNGDGEYAIEATYYYGYQCYVMKDYPCALSTFDKIGSKGPRTIQLYIAQIYYEQEEYEKAFDRVNGLTLSKKQNEIELLTGKIQYQLGNKSVALSHFDKYTGAVSELSPDEIYQFANANFEAGNFKKSTTYFLLISNNENAIGQAANYHLGVSDVQIGEKKRAMNAFAEAKRKDFDAKITEVSAFNYAKLAAELQQNNLAVTAIKDFIDKYPYSEYSDEAKTMMADIFLSTKNYKAAIEVMEELNEMNPKIRVAYQEITFHRGEELYLNKEYQNAHVFFKKSLKYPKNQELEGLAHFWMGEIAYKVDDYDESITELNKFMNATTEQGKNTTYAYYSLGYNYFKKSQYSKAQNYFEQFRNNETYSSINKEVYLDNSSRLADCYFLNRQYNPAIKEYQFIIENNYRSADYALFQQGMLYGLQERHSEKIKVLKKIQNDFPKSMYLDDALYQTAREYMALENYKMAESMFKMLISQHDYSRFLPDSYLKLGLIYYNQKDDEVALRYYKTVVERFPKTPASKEALSWIEIIYNNQGNPEAYFEYVKTVPDAEVSVTYQDSSIYYSAMKRYHEGDCIGATKSFAGYISRFGDNGYFIVPANYYKAECDYYNDRVNQALSHYTYVVESGRSEYLEKSLFKLASTYYRQKKYLKALTYYEQLEKVADENSTNYKDAVVGQMRIHAANENDDEAKAKAIQLLPISNVPTSELAEANLILGRIQLKRNNLLTAKSHFDVVIKANIRNAFTAEALYGRAYVYYSQDNLDDARTDIYLLNDDYSSYEFWVVKGFILLSDVYVKEADYFQAKATLQSILDNYKNESDGLLDQCRAKLKTIEELEKPVKSDELEEE